MVVISINVDIVNFWKYQRSTHAYKVIIKFSVARWLRFYLFLLPYQEFDFIIKITSNIVRLFFMLWMVAPAFMVVYVEFFTFYL